MYLNLLTDERLVAAHSGQQGLLNPIDPAHHRRPRRRILEAACGRSSGASFGSQPDDDPHPAFRLSLGRQGRKGPGPLSACRRPDCHNGPVRRLGDSILPALGKATGAACCGAASRCPVRGDGSGPPRDHPGGQRKATGNGTLPNRNGSAVLVVSFVALRNRVFGIDNDFEGVGAGAQTSDPDVGRANVNNCS